MDTGAWPDQGQALRSKSTQAWAPALARRFRSGRLEGRRRRSPTARPSGRVHDLVAADAPTAAPEAAPARTEISAASAPRPAVPAPAASAIRSRPASGIASRKAPARRPRSRVSNFEQTGEAGAGNCRTDGRVAQSAERVREQHETVVRNHSPAAIPLASGRQRTQAHGRSGNEPTRPPPPPPPPPCRD